MNSDDGKDALLQKIADTIRRYCLLAAGDTVLAAVSGGLDSMVLLYALRELGYGVEAAHFDHQTRAGESAEDAAFVKSTCALMGVPCHYGTEPIEKMARDSGLSFEGYARQRRYAFLNGIASRRGGLVVATGHQQDDQAETVIMGMLGLAGDIGPGGIAPSLVRDGVRIVRPLIACSRDELELWAATKEGLAWREDATNSDREFMRNRVRHEVLPVLAHYQPRVRERLAVMAEVCRSDAAYLAGVAAAFLDGAMRLDAHDRRIRVMDIGAFQAAPEAVRRNAVKVLACRSQVPITMERCLRVEAFLQGASTGTYCDFGGGFRFYMAKNGAHLLPPDFRVVGGIARTSLAVPGETLVSGHLFSTRVLPVTEGCCSIAGKAGPACQYFDWQAFDAAPAVRSREAGDVMTPFGMKHPRKIADIMGECGVPAYRRAAVPLMVAAGEVVWVPGCRRGAFAPVSASTRHMLEVRCRLHYDALD